MYHRYSFAMTLSALFLIATSDVRSQPAATSAGSLSGDGSQPGDELPTAFGAHESLGLVSSQANTPSDDLWLLREIHHDSWDGVSTSWVWQSKDVRQYDSKGLEESKTFVRWRSGAWQNDRRWLSVYDETGRLVEQTFQWWRNNQWVNDSRQLLTHGGHGKLTEWFLQGWSGGVWNHYRRGLSAYDEQGRLIEQTSYEWNGGNWTQLPEVFQYSYDGEGRLSTQTTLLFENGNLAPLNRQTVGFDVGGNQTSRLYEVWSGGAWAPDMRFSYRYNGDVSPEPPRSGAHPDVEILTERLLEAWRDNIWNTQERIVGVFDSMGRQIERTTEYWQDLQWVGVSRWSSTFDPEGLIDTVFFERWADGAWNPNSRTTFSWERFAGQVSVDPGSDLPQSVSLRQNYPNPFNPATTISYDLPQAADVKLVVFDVLGRPLTVLASGAQAAGTYEVSFDASDLPSGTYFYRLEAAGRAETKQMAVVK